MISMFTHTICSHFQFGWRTYIKSVFFFVVFCKPMYSKIKKIKICFKKKNNNKWEKRNIVCTSSCTLTMSESFDFAQEWQMSTFGLQLFFFLLNNAQERNHLIFRPISSFKKKYGKLRPRSLPPSVISSPQLPFCISHMHTPGHTHTQPPSLPPFFPHGNPSNCAVLCRELQTLGAHLV